MLLGESEPDTNSSRHHTDGVSCEDRLAADPGLEPELALARDEQTRPIKPPPEGGGWGYHPDYGWGYFPPQTEPSPKRPSKRRVAADTGK